MLNFFKKLFTGKPFALYITDSHIQVVQMGGDAKNPQLQTSGQRPLKAGIVEAGKVLKEKELATEIKALLAGAKPMPIKETSCYLALPEAQVYEHIFYLPATLKGNDFNTELNRLIAETFPIPFHELQSRHHAWTCGSVQVVAVMAAKREVIAQYYQVLKDLCKLEPSIFEPESLSLLRNIPKNFSTDQGTLLVDIHDGKIFWYSLWKEDVFDSGIFHLSDLEKSAAQLTKEIQISAQSFYNKTKRKIKEAVISGELAQKEVIKQNLAASLQIPVTFNEKYKFGNAQFEISCGLALKSIANDSGSKINFLQK